MRFVIVAWIVLAAPAARADWYGDQIAASDALAVTSFYGMGKAEGNPAQGALLIGGVFFTLVGPALIHAHHDNYTGMDESLGLRVGLPLTGALVGHMFDPACEHCWIPGGGTTIGVFAGYAAAVIFDAAVLARTSSSDPTTARVISFSVPFR